MGYTRPVAPKSPPLIPIPPSPCTVEVRVIDTNTLVYIDTKLFCQPQLEGFAGHHAPIYCFLISNGKRHVIFDLGVRTDWKNYAPSVVSLIEATTVITVGSDVASVLNSDTSGVNIRSTDIESIIWSHNHFDHIGDTSTFPTSTELVVGPGVRDASWPGWPQIENAKVLESDMQGRKVREISFNSNVRFGSFPAFDFFGDGSFYLLDAPGHAPGHLCAAARCTTDPPSFVFMGADSCHHAGVLRPTEYLPLPQPQAISPPSSATPQRHTLDGTALTPFQQVADGPLFPDHASAMETVRKIQELDAADNIFVLISHDLSLKTRIPFFPETINNFMEKNLKNDTRWLFCADYDGLINRLGDGES
ncbi:beta-lactamase-like protein [Nemania abortiva]|nr:beta-lactamase-like protein [Nemania abortiva]